MTSTLDVVLLMRPRTERAFSIEAVFQTVASHLPPDIRARVLVSPHPSRGLLPRLRGILHAARAARGADVIHMTGDAHYLVLLLPRRRAVLTVHDCEFLDRTRGLKRFMLWLIWIWLPARRVAAITVVSEASKAKLLHWLKVDPARIEVVENPLTKVMCRVEKAFAEQPRLLMIGTAPHKNINRVAEAVGGLPVTLEVIGRLPEDRLARLRRHVDVVTRHDLTDAELAEAYAGADILMFPSLSEGFGLPIIEAQAVGRPVITSDRAPMSDVAGAAALKVDPEDTVAIRTAVERLIDDADLRNRLIALGLENVRRFTPERAATAYAAVYRRVALRAE
ncbi:glycosyltransferase family 1 protein [Aestuariicoccus sp. MJ-SS9]|uniref:glycosyltransferase family 4 protein n=1 Tax=Aestuariicoccus sp. MJ-SS9 TaxID=3079855 RepID=UPI0029103AF9|nr:glycosyltransferase family 1 protein [Aestuariicoccus sp. MJ-SS9]MDU8913517.1 glycosyltransferase family 1 protein [Aestuariicoccus sp. MJ-SS9]